MFRPIKRNTTLLSISKLTDYLCFINHNETQTLTMETNLYPYNNKKIEAAIIAGSLPYLRQLWRVSNDAQLYISQNSAKIAKRLRMPLETFLDELKKPSMKTNITINCEDEYGALSAKVLKDFLSGNSLIFRLNEIQREKPQYFTDILDEVADYMIVEGKNVGNLVNMIQCVERPRYARFIALKLADRAIETERALETVLEFYRILCNTSGSIDDDMEDFLSTLFFKCVRLQKFSPLDKICNWIVRYDILLDFRDDILLLCNALGKVDDKQFTRKISRYVIDVSKNIEGIFDRIISKKLILKKKDAVALNYMVEHFLEVVPSSEIDQVLEIISEKLELA